jgi:hypothetical protein
MISYQDAHASEMMDVYYSGAEGPDAGRLLLRAYVSTKVLVTLRNIKVERGALEARGHVSLCFDNMPMERSSDQTSFLDIKAPKVEVDGVCAMKTIMISADSVQIKSKLRASLLHISADDVDFLDTPVLEHYTVSPNLKESGLSPQR